MEAIFSIRYDKRSGEFCIKRRDIETGKQSAIHANHLTENEKIFAKACSHFCEDEHAAIWTN